MAIAGALLLAGSKVGCGAGEENADGRGDERGSAVSTGETTVPEGGRQASGAARGRAALDVGGDGPDGSGPGTGEDVLYGGDGNDVLFSDEEDGRRDKLHCGEGKELYSADKIDHVDGSCEKIDPWADGAAARLPRTLVNSP